MMADFKFPKSLAACADLLHALKDRRSAAQKVVDSIEAEEKALIKHLIENIPVESSGVVGKEYLARTYVEQVYHAEDWEAFWKAFNPKRDRDLLQKRLSKEAVEARLDAGKPVPGVSKFPITKISLTRLKG